MTQIIRLEEAILESAKCLNTYILLQGTGETTFKSYTFSLSGERAGIGRIGMDAMLQKLLLSF